MTDKSSSNGINSVEMSTEKHHASVSVSKIGVTVLVKPLSSRLFGDVKRFDSFEHALNAYKLPAAKAMIEEARSILA